MFRLVEIDNSPIEELDKPFAFSRGLSQQFRVCLAGNVVSLRNVLEFTLKEDQNEVASGFTEFRKPQIDSVTTRPKREKLGCLCADCLFIEQHYQQPDSI